MSFKEYLYLFFVCCLFAIPITIGFDFYNEGQQKIKEKRINDSLQKIKVNLEIKLLKKKLNQK